MSHNAISTLAYEIATLCSIDDVNHNPFTISFLSKTLFALRGPIYFDSTGVNPSQTKKMNP